MNHTKCLNIKCGKRIYYHNSKFKSPFLIHRCKYCDYIFIDNYSGTRRCQYNKKLRTWYLAIDPHCYLCGTFLTKKTATLDHIIPKSKGGSNLKSNLRLCCEPCNKKKRSELPKEGGSYMYDEQWGEDRYELNADRIKTREERRIMWRERYGVSK